MGVVGGWWWESLAAVATGVDGRWKEKDWWWVADGDTVGRWKWGIGLADGEGWWPGVGWWWEEWREDGAASEERWLVAMVVDSSEEGRR